MARVVLNAVVVGLEKGATTAEPVRVHARAGDGPEGARFSLPAAAAGAPPKIGSTVRVTIDYTAG